jgi:hypothetical protein
VKRTAVGRQPYPIAFLVTLLAAGCDCSASGDRSDGTIVELDAARLDEGSIVIDGALDEDAWSRTETTGAFVRPGTGRPAPASKVPAEARIAYGPENLYFGFEVGDKSPTSPFSREADDPHIWSRASGIEIMLQPGDPGTNAHYYEVQVGARGAVWDTRFDDYNTPITGSGQSRRFGHEAWDSRLRRAVQVHPGKGYTVEVALPFDSLDNPRGPSPPSPGDVWRINLYAFRDGQRDSLAWSPILGEGNFHRTSRFGRVRFASSPSSGTSNEGAER